MKILQFHEKASFFGGGEAYFFDLCRALIRKGINIVCMHVSNSHYLETVNLGLKAYFIPACFGLRRGARTATRVIDIIKKENPDIVHFHGIYYKVSPLIVRIVNHIKPTIITIHEILNFCFKNSKLLPSNEICPFFAGWHCFHRCNLSERSKINYLKLLIFHYWKQFEYKRLDKIIVPSRYIYEELLRNKFPCHKLELLPHYLPICHQWTGSENNTFNDNDEKIILYIGRLTRGKGTLMFLKALSLITDLPWKAIIIGDGEEMTQIKYYLSKKNLARRVLLIGQVLRKNLQNYYKKSTVVVMPSLFPETFGFVGLEAMYFKRPVVAFNAGGISEWLIHGKNGFLIERGNIRMLAYYIRLLLENKEICQRFGKEGYRIVRERFSRERHIEKLLNIYEDVLNARQKTGHKERHFFGWK